MATATLDTQQPTVLREQIAAAQRELAAKRETPADVVDLVRRLADAATSGELERHDPYLVIGVQRAAIRALRALELEDPGRRRELRVALEQMRHGFRDMAAGEPVSEDVPAKALAQWLAANLDVSSAALADVIGVQKRTFERWVSPDGTKPRGEEAGRLRVVARIANHLRHAVTGPGVVEWFERPRRALRGRAPKDVVGDPDMVPELTTLAAGLRSSSAT